jgi:hypothetical protein
MLRCCVVFPVARSCVIPSSQNIAACCIFADSSGCAARSDARPCFATASFLGSAAGKATQGSAGLAWQFLSASFAPHECLDSPLLLRTVGESAHQFCSSLSCASKKKNLFFQILKIRKRVAILGVA